MKDSENICSKGPYHFPAELSLNRAKAEWAKEEQRQRQENREEG